MSVTDSEKTRKSGRIHLGISGRVPSERVADLRRNQWPAWVGIRSCLHAQQKKGVIFPRFAGHRVTRQLP